ncbi:MAG: hypothetical protein HXY30_06595 [Pseudorhodoplanes sp.]|nr:hypothetical protein [Pseudorhodoplanes sp.]
MNEKQLIKKALDYGIPSSTVAQALRFRRILGEPTEFLKRRSEAQRIAATSPYANVIDKTKGYGRFGPNDFPGIMDAVAAANRIRESKTLDGKFKKPFFVNLLEPADLDNNPELLALARSRPVLEAAAAYLGTVPELSGIGVFLSPANQSLEKSQQYHTDDVDTTQVKCFVNCNDIGPNNGPFTFITADASDALRRKLKHGWRGPRLSDEDVTKNCSPEDVVSITGGPGHGVLVDSSRCLHFGSRCREGYRLVIMFQLTRRPSLAIESDNPRGRTLIIDH